jgi:hypothetical protein
LKREKRGTRGIAGRNTASYRVTEVAGPCPGAMR